MQFGIARDVIGRHMADYTPKNDCCYFSGSLRHLAVFGPTEMAAPFSSSSVKRLAI
jgi:hypothetical protein